MPLQGLTYRLKVNYSDSAAGHVKFHVVHLQGLLSMKASARFAAKRAVKHFCKKVDTHLQKVGTEEYDNISFPIYHYTNLDGIEGILRSECLWLTNVDDLDDPTEITWVLDIALDKIRRGANGNEQPLKFFCQKFLSGIDTAMSEQFEFYSVSFCQHGNLDHLWSVFGDEGKGARIGFSFESVHFFI